MTPNLAKRKDHQRVPTLRDRNRQRNDHKPTWVVIRYVLVFTLVMIFFFPFLAMLTTSFKLPQEIFSAPPRLWPKEWTFRNYSAVFEQMPFWRYLANTLLIAGLSVFGMLLASPLVAYSLSKIKWRGQRPLLVIVMSVMMLPPQVTMIPLFLLWNKLGATNSIFPLVLPMFFGTPFLIFMIRQFFMSVPNELLYAGRVDGASELRIYWSIVLPIARPALITAAAFQFVWSWTDFLNPLIYLNDPSKYTLSIGLYTFFGQHTVDWGPLMAASVLLTIPALTLFVIFQRYFVGGISTGAIK